MGALSRNPRLQRIWRREERIYSKLLDPEAPKPTWSCVAKKGSLPNRDRTQNHTVPDHRPEPPKSTLSCVARSGSLPNRDRTPNQAHTACPSGTVVRRVYKASTFPRASGVSPDADLVWPWMKRGADHYETAGKRQGFNRSRPENQIWTAPDPKTRNKNPRRA